MAPTSRSVKTKASSRMATDTDSEMKNLNISSSLDVDNYRKLVQTYINLHMYEAALFWADKVVALANSNPKDVYWLAQCMFLLKQYHRAAHLMKSRSLDKTYVLCNNLTVRCLLEAKEYGEALKVSKSMNLDVFLQNPPNYVANVDNGMFDDTPRYQVQSAVLLLKGKVLAAMDNRGLAADCYRQALQCDVHCYEAYESLIQHNMLTASEEETLINSLPINEQCTEEEGQVLRILYRSKMKKYHTPKDIVDNNTASTLPSNTVSAKMEVTSTTPNSTVSIGSTPNIVDNATTRPSDRKATNLLNIYQGAHMQRLQESLDLIVAKAEQLYYSCDYHRCLNLTEKILKQDPYHSACLPIHISCLVELKQSNKLFTLAHNLVDLYTHLAISWFAVGCYYYVIGKSDNARKFLAKSTSLDKLFGPAWLAYGHSFAIENEHDQAMAAYFKASQLMRGCHLPLMYIGLECGLTNNIRLAEKFFQQANTIAPDDPFVLHEMGVIAFQNMDYPYAEVHFREALKKVVDGGKNTLERWAPLYNNLGHALRKQRKFEQALTFHHEALVLMPQCASTYAAIAYVHALMNNLEEAVDWFHRALGLRRDDTFSTTMLDYVIQQLSEEQPPYPEAPNYIPDFDREDVVIQEVTVSEESQVPVETSEVSGAGDMSISYEMDITKSKRTY